MSDTKPNQLATIGAGNRGVQLATVADMREVAAIMVQSRMCPDGYDTAAKIFVGLQSGAEMGLKPMQALNSIAVIHGKPYLWGDAALAMVKQCGLLVKYKEEILGDGDGMFAKVTSVRKDGVCESEVVSEFTVEDAKTAKLWGKTGPWKTHPKRMLKYKARAFNLRDNFPDILMGMHLQEEMIGEINEPLEAPQCDVPPRDDRRKKVISSELEDYQKQALEDIKKNPRTIPLEKGLGKTPPPKDPPEPVTDDSPKPVTDELGSGVGEGELPFIDADPIEDPTPEVAQETVEQIVEDLQPTESPYDRIVRLYVEQGGEEFDMWASEALCVDEDEVGEADLVPAKLRELEVHLEQNGVD